MLDRDRPERNKDFPAITFKLVRSFRAHTVDASAPVGDCTPAPPFSPFTPNAHHFQTYWPLGGWSLLGGWALWGEAAPAG
jgi:hypothetical protein